MRTPHAILPLITELTALVQCQSERIHALGELPPHLLGQRPGPNSWSILEILEHLNLFSGHYVRRLQKVYAGSGKTNWKEEFVPGRWGDKFTLDMLPGSNGRAANPMRALWLFRPKAAKTKGIESLHEFRDLLKAQLDLLDLARTRGLEGRKVTSTLGPLFRFKAGDAFRFMIAHQQRHFLQLERAMGAVEGRASA